MEVFADLSFEPSAVSLRDKGGTDRTLIVLKAFESLKTGRPVKLISEDKPRQKMEAYMSRFVKLHRFNLRPKRIWRPDGRRTPGTCYRRNGRRDGAR